MLAVVEREGLAEDCDAEEGLHGLGTGGHRDLVDLCEAVGSESVLALGDFVAEELGGAVAYEGLGVLEVDNIFFTAEEYSFEADEELGKSLAMMRMLSKMAMT